jgi:hypothetical protein
MAWKNFVSLPAIAPRRRIVASALVYGLSLTVRFTSPMGEEAETPAQAVQSTNPMTAIKSKDSVQLFYKVLDSKFAQPITFHRGWLLGSRGCGAACESPMPKSLMPSCSAP